MKPEKIILTQEENVVSLVDTTTTKIKQNINPVNDIHCTSMLVPSNKSMFVVTTTSVETIMETVPTFNPLSVQTISTTMISSSKDFPVTTLSSAVKVSTSFLQLKVSTWMKIAEVIFQVLRLWLHTLTV